MLAMNQRPTANQFEHPQNSAAKHRSSYALGGFALALLACLGACSSPEETGDGDGASGGTTGASGGATGASGGATGSGGAADTSQLPSDTTQAGIEAFIAAGTYKSWTHDAAPRTSPAPYHGNLLQVYFNDLAVAAGDQGEPVAGGMVVKELYDEGTSALVGTAVSIRTEGEKNWIYYCTNAGGNLCAVNGAPDPIYDAARNKGCEICHGNQVLAHLPE